MLINQIQKTKFSESEAIIMRYVLSKGEAISTMTIQEIADATYTSAPLMIRIAKKLGFPGWNDFKKAFIDELQYLETQQDVDASIPFVTTDDPMTIAANLSRLHEDTAKDTKELLHHDELIDALSLIRSAKAIDVYVTSDYYPVVLMFQQRLYMCDMTVNIATDINAMDRQVIKSNPEHVALVISYSGETKELMRIVKQLRHRHIPIIAITSISRSYLSQQADVVLHMSSREMLNTKIAHFASSESLSCLLDILYGCIFAFNYDEHLETVFQMADLNNDNYTEYSLIADDQGNR